MSLEVANRAHGDFQAVGAADNGIDDGKIAVEYQTPWVFIDAVEGNEAINARMKFVILSINPGGFQTLKINQMTIAVGKVRC